MSRPPNAAPDRTLLSFPWTSPTGDIVPVMDNPTPTGSRLFTGPSRPSAVSSPRKGCFSAPETPLAGHLQHPPRLASDEKASVDTGLCLRVFIRGICRYSEVATPGSCRFPAMRRLAQSHARLKVVGFSAQSDTDQRPGRYCQAGPRHRYLNRLPFPGRRAAPPQRNGAGPDAAVWRLPDSHPPE